VRVHHITAYYPGRGDDWVIAQGVSAEDVGTHAGTHDTSSLMYLNPSMLRFNRMGPGKARSRATENNLPNSVSPASAARGREERSLGVRHSEVNATSWQ
jgi:creatinine amidohydrolase/Fe(II)-dependent formamide hydrolase-like protein